MLPNFFSNPLLLAFSVIMGRRSFRSCGFSVKNSHKSSRLTAPPARMLFNLTKGGAREFLSLKWSGIGKRLLEDR